MANCFEWVRRKKEPTSSITLVIIGLDDAGKTTMVASLQGEPPDGITPTIGFANAEFSMESFKVTIYDLGGGVRIRDVWRSYYAEVFGVVFVVDSCNTERLEESKNIICQVAEHEKISGKPFLVFANKQDKDGAISANEITDILELGALSSRNEFPFKVVECSALKGYGRNMDKNINTGFKWLLSTISGEFSKISARVEYDMAIKKEEDEREKKARMERVRKIREERDRLEREAGGDPDKEDSDDDVMLANPFQPIGKHIEKVTAKDKKKKKEKENQIKELELNSTNQCGLKSKEEMLDDSVPSVKKKKKKRKNIKENEDNETELDTVTGNICNETHNHVNERRNGEVVDDQLKVVRKKKKKKKKIIKVSSEETFENLNDEQSDNDTYGKTSHPKLDNVDDYRSEDQLNDVVIPKKKKQKKKKKALQMMEETIDNKFDTEIQNHEDNSMKDVDTMKLDDMENEVVTKKPKIKKRRKKRNQTVPINDTINEDRNDDVLPRPTWNNSPRTWSSLPPIGHSSDQHSGGLPPLNSSPRLAIGEAPSSSSMQKLSLSPTWAKPNSEDNDIVT
eukprot:gene305-934_t